MRTFWWRLFRDEEAATAVEYAVILASILLVVLGTIGVVGSQSGGMWGGVQNSLNSSGLGS